MKIYNSLKSVKKRDKNNYISIRKGRIYILNKINKKYKGRQG